MTKISPLKEFRDQASLTQREFGDLVGVDALTVSRWERGANTPRKHLWPKIKEITGIETGVEMRASRPAA